MKTFVVSVLLLYITQQIYCASLKGKLSEKHENLISHLSNYRFVRPYRSTPEGAFLTFDLSSNNNDVTRHRRSTEDESIIDKESSQYHFVLESVDGEEMMLNLEKNTKLFSPTFSIDHYTENDDVVVETPDIDCFYQGHVGSISGSVVAISNCNGMSGWISVGNDEYVIEPVDFADHISLINTTYDGTHLIYRTTDHEGHEALDDLLKPINLMNDELFVESSTDEPQRSKRYTRVLASDQTYYVETLLAADKSVHDFHGSAVSMYLATLMNIVNALYSHESLGFNIKIVIVKIALLNQEQSESIIIENNYATSLTNANAWATTKNKPDDSHPKYFDMTAFITRTSFGPAGYASVNGICSVTRSCSLNIDTEGLRGAFVIAHEAAHLLGVKHDGQSNACSEDARSSAIMSPYVTANFHDFYWSTCTRNQIFKQINNGALDCLLDTPTTRNDETTYPGLRSTLDEQCRFIKGPDAQACRDHSVNPCIVLRCMTPSTPDACNETPAKRSRTRPLEGTPCGSNKWCIQGQCLTRDDNECTTPDCESNPRLVYEWYADNWAKCSITCGTSGVKTRVVTCKEVTYDKSGRLASIGSVVDNDLCHPDTKPATTAECLTRLCSANWDTGSWSSCSVTCGEGTQTRDVTCDRPKRKTSQYKCYSPKPSRSKICNNDPCETTGECTPDGSICKPKHYKMYCHIPGYEQRCCATCEEQKAIVATWKGKRTEVLST